MARADSYFGDDLGGLRLLTWPWICRSTVSVRRRKSTSPSCRPAASPSRNPAKAHTAIKARKSAGATASACATCSGVGTRILVSALGTFGGVIATVGS